VNGKERWRLQHIAEAIDDIIRHAAHRGDGTTSGELILHAVLYNIGVVGEAVGQLSEETRALAPEIPWKQIKGMRNLLAHEYFNIDADLVWRTVDEHMASLRAAVQKLLAVDSDGKPATPE
jgi:uncharacterized protein with HEPN domain